MSGTVTIEGEKLVFELHGVDEILAFRRRIEVPMEHVVSASTEEVAWGYGSQIRAMGTDLPGVVKDGTYLTDDGTVFFEMHHPENCVTVTLNNDTYRKIVFEVEDKVQVAAMINSAVQERAPWDDPSP